MKREIYIPPPCFPKTSISENNISSEPLHTNKAGLAPICQPQGRRGTPRPEQGERRPPRVPGGAAGVETGFVLQFRACSAKGGKPWPRPPSHGCGSHAARPGSLSLGQALAPSALGRRDGVSRSPRPNREACSAAAREKRPLAPQTGRLPSRPAGPGLPRGVPRRPRRFRAHLTSFGSRPVSLRIFSSTFLRLSLAFSSCSCKVLTATAIFSLQRAPRLLDRPRSAAPHRAAPAARRGRIDSPPQPMTGGLGRAAATTQGPEGEGAGRSVTPDQ